VPQRRQTRGQLRLMRHDRENGRFQGVGELGPGVDDFLQIGVDRGRNRCDFRCAVSC